MGLMRSSYWVIAGFGLGLIVSACATTFPYKYWGLDLKDQELLGPTPSDDRPIAICTASAADASPCTVMMTSTLLALKKDYEDTKDALIACQQAK